MSPEQSQEFIQAAEPHYTYDLAYHNWDHAQAVMRDVSDLIDRAGRRGIVLSKQALIVAAAWHDAGFHEDHIALGFPTKEHYSAFLLDEYLKDKDVSDQEKQFMRDAILGTIHNSPRETLDTLALHRADVANIGGEYNGFLVINKAIWKENQYLRGETIPFHEHAQSTRAFVRSIIDEAIRELPRLGEPIQQLGSFDVRAEENSLLLLAEPEQS